MVDSIIKKQIKNYIKFENNLNLRYNYLGEFHEQNKKKNI